MNAQPGYQKLKGRDALDYVRYRHGDNDFFRASRQQDFLRQVSHQDAIRQLLAPGQGKPPAPTSGRGGRGKAKSRAPFFGRYFEVDASFVDTSNLFNMAQLGLYMAQSKA